MGGRTFFSIGFNNMIRYFLYYMLMAGVVWDGNPQGALRAIKELDRQQQLQHDK